MAFQPAQVIVCRENVGLGHLGISYAGLGEQRKAIGFFEQALVIARELGDRQLEASGLGNMGLAWKSIGELDKSITMQEQGLSTYRELGHRQNVGIRLTGLAHTYSAKGEVEKAKVLYAESASILREIGDKLNHAHALFNLANRNHQCADEIKAKELMEQARALYAACDSLLAFDAEAKLAEWSGDMGKMVEPIEKALAAARKSEDRAEELSLLINLGDTYQKLSNLTRSLEYTEAAMVIACETNSRDNEGICLHNLGEYQLALGNLQESRDYYARSLAIATEINFRLLEANCRRGLSQIKRLEGDVTGAIALAEPALTIYDAIEAKAESETDMRFDVVDKYHGDVVDVPGAEWNAGSKANHKFTLQECSAAMQKELEKLH